MAIDSWLAFPTGILIATVVSSIGLGGGILWMPFFLIVLRLKPETAVVSSLLIQTAGMGSSSVAFLKQRLVDHKLALFLLMVAVPGVTAGAYITSRIHPSNIELILGILTLTTAFLFVSSSGKYTDLGQTRAEMAKAHRYSFFVMLMSTGSGMLSVSIGEWLIPIMRTKLNLKMTNSVATSIVIIFGTCVIGASLHLIMGAKADVPSVLWAVPGVIIGGQIGPRITERINDRFLKEIFVFLLTLVGIHLIYNSY